MSSNNNNNTQKGPSPQDTVYMTPDGHLETVPTYRVLDSTNDVTGTPANITSAINYYLSVIFTRANLIFFLWFLAIYLIAYILLGMFFKKPTDSANNSVYISRSIDFMVLLFLFIYLLLSYVYTPESIREQIFEVTVDSTYRFLDNPTSILTVALFLIFFYIVLYLFRIPMDPASKPSSVSLIEFTTWILFIFIVFIDFFKYTIGVSLLELLSSLFNFNTLPSNTINSGINSGINKSVTSTNGGVSSKITGNVAGNALVLSKPAQKDEVFNISNNLYTFDDAQAVCSAYGAKIASYDQIEDAYKSGAEWCNYGWSEGQMAYFPTQKATWQKLQQTKDHKNDCGRPGVNGGYMANPYIKFGVNCYGKKPTPTDADLARMSANSEIIVPKSASDIALESKVKFWKDNADKMLVLNSFDRKKWFEY